MRKPRTKKATDATKDKTVDLFPKVEVLTTVDSLMSEVKELKKIVTELTANSAKTLVPLAPTVTKRDKLILNGNKTYVIEAVEDGLSFTRENETALLVGKNGQLSTGTRSPRTVGKGSAHFRAGSTSESIIPSAGVGSTRGVIVEGDGDDDKTFVFRAVSRMNRQGFNVFSDGALSIGSFEKLNGATLGVYHRHSDLDGIFLNVASKDFSQTMLCASVKAPVSQRWQAVSITADCDEKSSTTLFNVDGEGTVASNNGFVTNHRGYAEYFEWADGNHRNEDRTGYTVTVSGRHGKLRVADEGDTVIGVVVSGAAIVGNSAWNHWDNKFAKNRLGKKSSHGYSIVEWLETESTLVKSYYKDSLRDNFATPENAVEIQTDIDGNPLTTTALNNEWDNTQTYVPRSKRKSWALVCLLGSAPIYKGQTVNPSWLKLYDLSNEIELQLIK